MQASGGNGTYTWSPNVGLSATTGASVVVSPLPTTPANPTTGYTTYTVTSTNPATGATMTATARVFVSEKCCPQSKNQDYLVNIPGSLFNASTGSPFANYPAGTRFHFTGSSPIIFSGLAFQPPMGSVIMMGAGKDLYLQDGASLNLAGVSITAACNDMWGKLWVRNSATGISSTFADGATGQVVELGYIGPRGQSSLRNEVSQSLGGIDFEQPSPAVTNSSGAVNVPYCHLTATDFRQNEQSIVLNRVGYGRNIAGGTTYTYVSYSSFDSAPVAFKAPKAYASTSADYPHYARYHVRFAGHGGFFFGSSLRHALFGLHNANDGEAATLRVNSDQFSDCYLAGVNVNTSNDGTRGVEVVYVNESTFTFPTLLSLPTTPQFADAISTDVLDQVGETRGVFVNNPTAIITTSAFTQADDPYTSFAFAERYKQVGVKARRLLSYNSNTATLLHTGLEMTDVLTTAPTIENNVFTACRRGLEAHGAGVAYRGSSSCCPPATVSLPLSCNTFDRVNATRPGTSYGVYLENGARISFDPIPYVSPAPILKNKFLDYSAPSGDFYAIFNGSGTTMNWVNYTTYTNYIQRPTLNGPGILPGHSDLGNIIGGITGGITLHGGNNYRFGQACGTGNPGLERVGKPQSSLEPSSPNPASGFTTVRYQLSPDATAAEIQVRRSTDGKLMQQTTLRNGSTAYQLGLHNWPAGVYAITLYVDAVPTKSTKLIVQ